MAKKGYSDGKIAALKILVANHPCAPQFCKKVVFWLIDQSESLTKPVKVSIPSQFSESVQRGIREMNIGDKGRSLVKVMVNRGLSGYFFAHCSDHGVCYVGYYPNRKTKSTECNEVVFDQKAINLINIHQPKKKRSSRN